MATTARRADKADIRLTAEAKQTLRSAAETLPDRTRFDLGVRQWAEFQALLDGPPRDLPRLAKLLKTPSEFER